MFERGGRLGAGLALGLAALGLARLAAAEPAPWPEAWWNPAPLADDLVLPMPCGGAMAFRPVAVPEGVNPLADRRFTLGREDDRFGYLQGRRTGSIAGAFVDPDNDQQRVFWMSKTEVANAQIAVLGEPCPKSVSRGDFRPRDKISWFDAVAFSRRYTEWLMVNAPDALPVAGERLGFLRLPTEEEWEFAARGGVLVSEVDFARGRYPMIGDAAGYVAFQGPRSARGKLQLVGMRKANPLGLHDMLGNVREMAFGVFRLNSFGRPHGQAGGFIARGGDINTPLQSIDAGARFEYPFFDARKGTATALPRLGFRLVLTAPVIVSEEREAALRDAFTAGPPPATVAERRQAAAESKLLEIAANAADATRAELDETLRELRGARADRLTLQSQVLRLMFDLGASLGAKTASDIARERAIAKAAGELDAGVAQMRELARTSQEAAARLPEFEARLARVRDRLEAAKRTVRDDIAAYGDAVKVVSDQYDPSVIDSAYDEFLVATTKTSRNASGAAAGRFYDHLVAYRTRRETALDHLREDLSP